MFWLDWALGNEQERKPHRFSDAALEYLTSPIQFQVDKNCAIYPIIKIIYRIENAYDEEYCFDFTISPDPPPASYRPSVTDWKKSKKQDTTNERITVVRYKETVREANIYSYTFTSLNSLRQNQDNLHDFAVTQWLQREDDEIVIVEPDERQRIDKIQESAYKPPQDPESMQESSD